MNPQIILRPKDDKKPLHYMVVFETMADRTRWLLQNGFRFNPTEECLARWTKPDNGRDKVHWLEIHPYVPQHWQEIRALTMMVKAHDVSKRKEFPKYETRDDGSDGRIDSHNERINLAHQARIEIDALIGLSSSPDFRKS